MGAGKNPYLRYRIIHSCLSSKQKRYWTKKELIQKLADHDFVVENRSLDRDIENMRHDDRLGYHAPIAYDRYHPGYHYTDPQYSIDNIPLTEEDLEVLTAATNILYQYKHVKLVKQFEGMVDRLGKAVNHLKQPQNSKLIAFEYSPYYKGHDFFDDILSAISNQRVLSITYRKFAGTKNDEHILHPYFLKEYRGRWYVLGYSEARHYILTLALDRMVRLAATDVLFKENKTLKPKEYFQYTLGITLGKGPAEEIKLWFSPIMAPYIRTQHLHHTQKTICEDEGGLVISLKLIPNPELVQLILSYGAEVKVLEPESLRERVREVMERGVGLYDK